MELIPNNLAYGKVFKNSYLPICITGKNGDIVYQTNLSKYDIMFVEIKDV